VPVETLPTRVLTVVSSHISAEELAGKLRHASPPVFARIFKDAVVFDFRTIHPAEDSAVLKSLVAILG
jgi:L-seryl-tRNA(Ser) seleniumtransferase